MDADCQSTASGKVSSMSKEGPPSSFNPFKKRLKSSFAIGTNSTQIVQNLRVTNKCLSARLGKVTEDFHRVQKQNVQLTKQNKELRKQIQELKQNPMLDRATEIKEYIENLKNKVFILNSVASGAVETVVELSQLCLSGKSAETCLRSSMTTPCSVPLDVSGDLSVTDSACSVSANAENTHTKTFPDASKYRRSGKKRQLLQTHCKQQLCLSSSEDDSIVTRQPTERWSFCDVVASKSASSAYICENKHDNYVNKFLEADACVTSPVSRYMQRRNIDSAPKIQKLEAWMTASKFHNDRITSDMPLLKSVNACGDEKPQSGCNAETISQNSPKAAELHKSPVTLNQQRSVGLQQGNRPKSRSVSPQKIISPENIPYTGNMKSSKTSQKSIASTFKKRSSSTDKTKLKTYDDINTTRNQPSNLKLSSYASPTACNRDKNNIESDFNKTNYYKVGGQENAMKTPLSDVSTRILKSQKCIKAANKMYKNSCSGLPKTQLKSKKQKLKENAPVFLNAKKQRLKSVLSMPVDEVTFPLPSFKNEALSSQYETFSVDRLSKIHLCAISSKSVQLEKSSAQGMILQDILFSVGDAHSKQWTHDTKRNDCDNSKLENSKHLYEEVNRLPPTQVCPLGTEVDNPQCEDNGFEQRCVDRSVDNVKQNGVSVAMSNDCNKDWLVTNDDMNSAEQCKCNDVLNAQSNARAAESRHRSPVKDAIINRCNPTVTTLEKINIRKMNKDQNAITSAHSANNGNCKHCFKRPHSAMLKTEKSHEVREVKQDGNRLSNSHSCKIKTVFKKMKCRPHSVASIRSKTKMFDYEAGTKIASTPTKSTIMPVNTSYDECERIHICDEKGKRRDNVLSPSLPVNETSEGTSVRMKKSTRSLLTSGKGQGVIPYTQTESLASYEKAQLKHLMCTKHTATIESREMAASNAGSEKTDVSSKYLKVKPGFDIANNGVSDSKAKHTVCPPKLK